MPTHQLMLGDCLMELASLKDNSVDSIVTDPPYGISFMSKRWDYDVPSIDVWKECMRVLKPGGHMLVACGTRTQHRMVVNIEDAGFEIRDVVTWLYGSGFPKSLNISKAIDKEAGAEREVIGNLKSGNQSGTLRLDGFASIEQLKSAAEKGEKCPNGRDAMKTYRRTMQSGEKMGEITAPATDAAKQWNGWGTALKPACEFFTLCRKPISESTVAKNVVKWGAGGINVDGCRVSVETNDPNIRTNPTIDSGASSIFKVGNGPDGKGPEPQGRWPANLLFDEEAAEMLDEQSGVLKSGQLKPGHKQGQGKHTLDGGYVGGGVIQKEYGGDSGGASRFFYVAKASKRERNAGLDGFEHIKLSTDLCKEENTVLAALLQKVTSESTVKWNIAECGEAISAIYPKECKSIIETEISKITESKILNSLALSLTNESTADVSLKTENGSSHAANVQSLKEWILNITSAKTESALGVVNVALKMLLQINENAKPLSNFHSTVKPVKLMEYLCKLITPPGGTVLDPFMGSGSTGVAALNLGFDFVGIEREHEYLEIARGRVSSR